VRAAEQVEAHFADDLRALSDHDLHAGQTVRAALEAISLRHVRQVIESEPAAGEHAHRKGTGVRRGPHERGG